MNKGVYYNLILRINIYYQSTLQPSNSQLLGSSPTLRARWWLDGGITCCVVAFHHHGILVIKIFKIALNNLVYGVLLMEINV